MKLRALFKKHIMPIIMQYFGVFFEPVLAWLKDFDVHLFTDCVSSVGLADLYWARAHVDDDAWHTILVVVDTGEGLVGGGDFCFPSLGVVMEARSGDVFFFNPTYIHACTEAVPKPKGSRLYISFYCKRDVLNAATLSKAMAKRLGNAPLSLCRVR